MPCRRLNPPEQRSFTSVSIMNSAFLSWPRRYTFLSKDFIHKFSLSHLLTRTKEVHATIIDMFSLSISVLTKEAHPPEQGSLTFII